MKRIKNTLLLLFTINLLWGIICAIPSLFVVGFTLDGWFSSSYQNPDSFFPPSRGEELWMLTIASVFFILYYFHLIVGAKGFMINDTYLKKYSSHFQYNILLTLLGLGFYDKYSFTRSKSRWLNLALPICFAYKFSHYFH
ncbi:MAG: hypothetical protein IPJ79_20330 [Bacteroidetes bacterium]|nr:hypothetical protein [Bacteroidota bacterium]